jgi:RNA polymerase sigma-70 factor (ECF subfamily)
VDEFEAQRPRMFGLAYRLLGSADDAQDVVQDAFERWHGADRAAIVAPSAWLAKVVTNLSLTRLTSAHARRERYVGPWLPEPVITSDGTLGPLDTAEQRDTVSAALLMLMERLTPTERAVFVLREAFGHSYEQIAQILEMSPANCRQLQHRAVRRLGGRRRFRPDAAQWRELVERFLVAAEHGDLRALERMLAADATVWSDGGGRVGAARRPVRGRDRVLRMVAGLAGGDPGAWRPGAEVNGGPALLGWNGGRLVGVVTFEVVDGRIAALHAVVNPDKLRFAARQAEDAVTSRPPIQS